MARIAAVAWLMVLAPAELAAALARAIVAPSAGMGLVAAALIALRVLVTAGGLMLGRHLLARRPVIRFALTWAVADLGTLALALASDWLPSSRMPGDAPIVWGLYAVAALVVIGAVAATAPAQRTAGAATTPH